MLCTDLQDVSYAGADEKVLYRVKGVNNDTNSVNASHVWIRFTQNL
jgi:hypothetical protein